MNTLLWVAQIILAGVFLFTGFSKIFAYGQVVKVVEARSKAGRIGMSRAQAVVVGLLEIAGAAGVLVPTSPGGGGTGAADGGDRRLSRAAPGVGSAGRVAVFAGVVCDCGTLAAVGGPISGQK
jgi:hypothetical protein